MELIPLGTRIDFLGKARYAFLFSGLLMAFSVYMWIATGEARYGIDFMGGHEIVVEVKNDPGSEVIRQALESKDIQNAIVQSFEAGSDQYSVRLEGDAGEAKAVRDRVQAALADKFGSDISILKTDFVGPAIGNDLKKDALIALTLGLLGMLIYISFRFEMSFAFGAVAALLHDVVVCVGFYLLAGHTFNMNAVAAALTIIGYSLNDTIVIFDRVREELRKRKNPDLPELMNESLNVTLSRTIVTSLLTFFSALALLVVGGGAVSDLALFLVVGIVAGSYSTIYIASPAALFWERMRSRRTAAA